MSSLSCFMSRGAYKRYYAEENRMSQSPLIGRPDIDGNYRVCCMPSEEADAFVASHTNADGTLDYRGMEHDLGLDEKTFKHGVWRVDFKTEGRIQHTEKGGPNDNGKCTGNGKLPGEFQIWKPIMCRGIPLQK